MTTRTYRERYAVFKDEVDSAMGRTRGRWARFKTHFFPNSFSAARKRAIEQAEENWEWELLMGKIERSAQKLYQTQNIIGKTQAPGERPTVYYLGADGTFGHITQQHYEPDNVGREPPQRDPSYTYGNTGPEGEFTEKYGGFEHKARGPMIFATTEDEREVMSEAHRIIRRIKPLARDNLRANAQSHATLAL
jgi:hypothetical protein